MKFVPKFSKGNGDYNGVGTFIFIIGIIGFSILTCFLCFGKPLFEYYYAENSQLFIHYFLEFINDFHDPSDQIKYVNSIYFSLNL